ncbi:MAG: YggS family pyridoxal phosphate-dependent enzyme, partial [Enterobacteriaceae bacterium]
LAPLHVLLQINISAEQSKSGIMLTEAEALAEAVSLLPRLRLRGLMAIPEACTEFSQQLEIFQQMQQAFKTLRQRYPSMDTLSMGMSDDMTAAIAAGSTMVRIGTAIFGARQAFAKTPHNQ